MPYYAAQSITTQGTDANIYTIYQADGFSDSPLSARPLTCDAGPVICVAQDTYEIWLSDARGPSKIVATTTATRPSAPIRR